MERREIRPITRIGLDEKSMTKGHHYLTVRSDCEAGIVIDVAENRNTQAATG